MTSVDRRTALKLAGAAALLPASACAPPREEIVPYVDMPEGEVPGRPRFYATALALTDYAMPAVVEAHQGRPTKVEGNARHPASGGASDAFAQAAVLSLYDPGRARAPLYRAAPGAAGRIASWDRLQADLQERRQDWARDGGAGLRLLTPPVCSPTLAAQIGALLATYPAARWHAWAPLNEDNARRGAVLAFGRPLQALPDLARARAVLALDADPLGPGPAQAMLARGWAAARAGASAGQPAARFYAVEPAFSLTGAAADHRLALPAGGIAAFAAALARRLGAAGGGDDAGSARQQPPAARRFLDAVAADLEAAGPSALVLAGPAQPPEVHALACAINRALGALGATLSLLEPVQAGPALLQPSIAALAEDMAQGAVTDLAVIGGNPAYDAPADLDFAARLSAVPFTLRLSGWPDETAALCRWHLPEHHPLETWSDARSADGRVSLVQPLIRPLFDSRSAHEVLAMLQGAPGRQGYEILRAHWRDRFAGEAGAFETWWTTALRDGVVPGSAPPPVDPESLPAPALAAPALAASAQPGMTLLFRPDPALWDGRFAGNAWLQELPQPFTKLAWGNALQLSPQEMAERGLAEGDLVRLAHDGAALELPVSALPGLAPATAVLHLGHGRRRAGAAGSGHGTDAYPLRRSGAMWQLDGIVLRRAGGRARLPRTQSHFEEAGRDIVREIDVRAVDLAALAAAPEGAPDGGEGEPPSLYPEPPVPPGPHAWGMAIDQAACIGCNACVVACQAENNVPVVGPEEIAAGRDMHWLRIDTYFTPDAAAADARARFQPVPCMHCEKAPCEPVCPVAASVHDRSGLNAQVYNRCIGTRDCQSTCPYQVRRFNFRDYAGADAYADLGDPLYALQRNPDVSVRSRGVMEKCTYCVQRISAARQDAEAAGRPLRDGDVVTACQAACPTRAISFGDLQDAGAEVVRRKAEPRNYALLGHLGIRPRTTYLARLRNPSADLAGGGGDREGGAE